VNEKAELLVQPQFRKWAPSCPYKCPAREQSLWAVGNCLLYILLPPIECEPSDPLRQGSPNDDGNNDNDDDDSAASPPQPHLLHPCVYQLCIKDRQKKKVSVLNMCRHFFLLIAKHISCLFFFFWWYWSLNSGVHAC
jgi:hypothetical protein